MSKSCRFFRYAVPVAFVLAMVSVTNDGALAQQPVQTAVAPTASQSAMVPAAPTSQQTVISTPPAQVADQTPVVAQENSYGLKALWSEGDIVSRITLLVMAVMSVGSWYVIVMKVIEQNRISGEYKEIARNGFWQQKTFKQSIDTLNVTSPYREIAENGVSAVQHHQGALQESIDLYSWVSMTLHRGLDHVQGRLQRGLALLGTVGSTAPFVGLFGTVWGIHHALSAISIAGQATLDKVAGPVGEALIMTAIGLATAVPAVLAYNFLVRRNKVIMDQVRNFTADVQCVLIGGSPQNKNANFEQNKVAKKESSNS